MIHRLRRKFILIAMGAVTLVMIMMCLSINIINFLTTDSDLEKTLQVLYDNQGTMPQFPGGKPGERPGGPFTVETAYSTRYFVLRYSEDGTLDSADMRHIAAVSEEDAGRYLDIALKHGEGFGYTEGSYKYYVARVGEGRYMAIFLDCAQELRSFRTFALASLAVVIACIVLVLVLVLLLSKRAIDPVVRSAERQKQFITDAGHELKTPLTVITTSLKVLEMEVGRQKWIDKARAQTDKMTELVNDLVILSRLDEEKPPISKCRFDVSGAVLEAADSFRASAEAQGHALELNIVPGLTYHGDEYAVRQLVSILLDNAIKYTDAGCPIQLSLCAAAKGVLLKTQNACAGIEPEELDKLFDRFYRADKARTRQEGGGFGVGLSIARSIVEAHRGTIQADCPARGIIRFTAVLC